MIRISDDQRASRRVMSRILILLLIIFFVCMNPGKADANGINGAVDPVDGKNGSASNNTSDFTVIIETIRLKDTSGTIILSAKGGSAMYYYLLIRQDGQAIPDAEEIKKDGIKSADGFISIPPVEEDIEYIFYAVAEDETGTFSETVSKRAVSSSSRGIEIEGHVYCTLQAREEIDEYLNMPWKITINTGSVKNIKKIEYIIADTFVNSPGLVDAIATEDKDVATSAGSSTVTFSKWAEYDPEEKPGLVRNMLNFVYVRMTDTDDNVTYYSSRGIWEDETEPDAESVTAEADETTAVVTVTGSDEESGIKTYYCLLRDPIDISAVTSEDVKKNGMASEDGIFELTGLTKRMRYDLYAVVEDYAGNLSYVRNGDLSTTGEASASSIRPGSNSSSPGTASNVEKRTEGVSLTDPEISEPVTERTPYLVTSADRDYSELIRITGWDNIKSIIDKSAEPGNIYIDMNGGVVVPADVLGTIEGRKITCNFIMDDKFIWAVNGSTIKYTPQSTDFRISASPGHIPAKLVNELAGVYPREEFSIDHNGTFGFPATLYIKLGTENEGRNAYLYGYNLNTYSLEPIETAVVDDRGRASFSVTEKSDYLVVVGPSVKEETEVTTTEQAEKKESTAADFANTGKNSGKLWIIIVSVIAVVLFVLILFLPRDKSDDRSDN